jgi:hypothetical protein
MHADHSVSTWLGDLDGLSVLHGELVAVTADGADHPLCDPIAALLQRIQRALAIDVVFVSLFAGGRPAIRHLHVDASQQGRECDPLELTVARQIVAARAGHGRLHYVAQPVVSSDGREFGTVCCTRSALSDGDQGDGGGDSVALQSVARLIALAMCKPDAELQRVWQGSAAASLGLR